MAREISRPEIVRAGVGDHAWLTLTSRAHCNSPLTEAKVPVKSLGWMVSPGTGCHVAVPPPVTVAVHSVVEVYAIVALTLMELPDEPYSKATVPRAAIAGEAPGFHEMFRVGIVTPSTRVAVLVREPVTLPVIPFVVEYATEPVAFTPAPPILIRSFAVTVALKEPFVETLPLKVAVAPPGSDEFAAIATEVFPADATNDTLVLPVQPPGNGKKAKFDIVKDPDIVTSAVVVPTNAITRPAFERFISGRPQPAGEVSEPAEIAMPAALTVPDAPEILNPPKDRFVPEKVKPESELQTSLIMRS